MEEEVRQENLKCQKLCRKYKVLIASLGILISALSIVLLALVAYTSDQGTIAKGVVIGIPVGGLPIEEAKGKLQQKQKEYLAFPVNLTADGQTLKVRAEELGLTYNYEKAFEQAYLIGRKGNLFEKAISKLRASRGLALDPIFAWNEQIPTETLNKYFSALNIPAENAHPIVKPDNTMEIIPEKIGRQVDKTTLISNIKRTFLDLEKTNPWNNNLMIPIPFERVEPTITKNSLENLKVTGLLSNYSTHFDTSLVGRTQNIQLAAKAIDLTLLEPNQVFSFNQTVGPRTAGAGYQTAIIIEGNKFVPGLGGGVCQVSSTLYNAVQEAHLEIIERAHHSLPITYVPPGQDATVAYPDLDFKFKNTTDGYLLIRSNITNGTLSFSLFGKVK